MKRIIVLCMLAGALSLHAEFNNGKADLPRVMVVLDEKIDNADAPSHKTSFKIESALLARGYRVIDAKQFDAVRQRDSAMRELNSKKALALARRFGAEILVTGGAQALDGGTREAYGFRSYIYSADASVKALATETGEVLAVFNAVSEKASQTKPTAAFKTLEAVGDSLGAAICASLEKAFEASREKTIELVVQGVDDAVIQKIETDLPAAAPAIRRAVVRFMEGDAATYDCDIRGNVDEVRKQLTTAKNFVVTGFSGSRIDVVYRARLVKHASAHISNALEITQFSIGNVFPAQGLHYVKHPIGTATVKNTSSAEVKNITARTFIAGYMHDPSEQTIASLQPGEERSIAVFALLDPEKLALVSQRTAAQLRMELSYEASGDDYSRTIVKPVSILSRHSVAWSDPQSAACFVTPNDEAVDAFAHRILADVQHDAVLLPSGSANMMNAVKMWEALQAMSFVYTADAWTSAGADVLDDVRYPRETLAMRSGDCDDFSALLASCLESVGVPTALAVTSDHVFVIFDTGVQKKNAPQISTDEKEYLVRGGTVWLPVETTMKNASFLAAWKEGAKQYRDADAKKLDIVEMHQAWKTYPPLDLAQADQPVAPAPAQAVIDLVNADIKSIGQDLMNQINDGVAALKKLKTEAASNRAALLLSVAGRFDEAVPLLSPYVSPASLNNLGNIYLLKGDSLNASRAYAAALKADRADAGIVLNQGVLNFMTGDEDAAEASLRRGAQLLDTKERAYELLGLPHGGELAEMQKESDVKKKVESARLKRLLDTALKDVQAKKEKDDEEPRVRRGENKFVFGGRRGLDPSSVMELKDILYWKKL
jgi:transglutaminase-like putative cysteine protease